MMTAQILCLEVSAYDLRINDSVTIYRRTTRVFKDVVTGIRYGSRDVHVTFEKGDAMTFHNHDRLAIERVQS